VQGDGNCLFETLALMLKNDEREYSELRKTAHYIINNWK
jgi:hypothetical protein